MRYLLLPLCLMVLLVSGCATPSVVGSFCGPLPEQNAVTAIAADAVDCLTALYPPGHTSLHLLPAGEVTNGFATALENGLRAEGFTLAAAEGGDIFTVAYVLDALDEKSAWYLQLRISDGKIIARSYAANGRPEAGQSWTEREFRSGRPELI